MAAIPGDAAAQDSFHKQRFAPRRAFAEAAVPQPTVAEADSGRAVNVPAADAFHPVVSTCVARHR